MLWYTHLKAKILNNTISLCGLASPAGLSDSHIRFRSIGPFRYVWFKLRLHSFSPTDAPNPLVGFSSSPQSKNKIGKMPIWFLVRAKGIEPSPKAWEAFVLPLYYARKEYGKMLYYFATNVQNFISFCHATYRPMVLRYKNCAVYQHWLISSPVFPIVVTKRHIFQYTDVPFQDCRTIEYQ